MTSVVVLDYGSGNLRSAQRALESVGAEVVVTSDVDAALNADGLLARVFLSRGFTCYQMEAAVTRKLLPFLESAGVTPGNNGTVTASSPDGTTTTTTPPPEVPPSKPLTPPTTPTSTSTGGGTSSTDSAIQKVTETVQAQAQRFTLLQGNFLRNSDVLVLGQKNQ